MAAHVMDPFGDFLCPRDAPSPIFTTFAVVTNLVGGIWALAVGLNHGSDCDRSTRVWVLIGAANNLVNGLFAIYIYYRFREKVRGYSSGAFFPAGEQPFMGGHGGGPGSSQPMRPSEAAAKLLMYDWGVCLYMVFIVWEIVWAVVSVTTYSTSNYPGDDCSNQLKSAAFILMIYGCVGTALVFLSLLTECCRQPRWHEEAQTTRYTTQASRAANTAANAVGSVVTGGVNAVRRVLGGPAAQPQPVYAAQPAYAQQPQAQPYQHYHVPVAQPPPQQQQQHAPDAGLYVRPPPTNPSYQPQYQ